LSNSAGEVAETYAYDSYGKVTASTGTLVNPVNPLQYTGREFDSETGIYYYRARYFDPSVGRFLSQDPIRYGGGVNFYAYTRNRPVLLTDPSGYQGGCPPSRPIVYLRIRTRPTRDRMASGITSRSGPPHHQVPRQI
jgi:RHS repeat-associated protein